MNLDALLKKSLIAGDLSFDEIVYLLSLTSPDDIKQLTEIADMVRHNFVGDGIHIRGLVEFSNICARSCVYCGIRCENSNIHRYRMPINEIIETAEKIADEGVKTVVLQSGEDPWYTSEKIAQIVYGIKANTHCAITLSVGERTYDEYKVMKEAGADRYLLRHETANPDLYKRLHPGMEFASRKKCLEDLKELGYQVGAGCMVGLPGQTIEDMAKDVLFVRDIDADMVGVGPFIPHPNTPLGNESCGTMEMTLKMLALIRITTRNSHLPATTAIGTINADGRIKALRAGANVLMPNYTPLKYRDDYEIYPNKKFITKDPEQVDKDFEVQLKAIGRKIAVDYGHSYKLP